MQTTWLSADQKIALSESLRSRILARGAEKLDAAVVTDTLKDWRAALCIQAAFRGWQWRKAVLWNPHQEVGRRRLHQIAERACCQGPVPAS